MGLSRCAPVVLATALLLRGWTAGAQTLPAGFFEQVVFRGLDQPTAVRFASDGRVFVAEKSGVVKVFRDLDHPTPAVFADLRTSVNDYGDRGLFGLALPADFPRAPWVYVLYTLDAAPGGTPPTWGVPGAGGDVCPEPAGGDAAGCVVGARLARLRAAGDRMAGDEQVLLDRGWCAQFPSHSAGDLAFGEDGALYASAGDGASVGAVDWGQWGGNACGDPPQAGGALRAQSPDVPGASALFDGAVLRLDPETGRAFRDNPHAGRGAADDRIVGYGFRYPSRIAPRPGTREVWVADVGWRTWEEIDRIADVRGRAVENFGWPCLEGDDRQEGYVAANLGVCARLLARPGDVTAPVFAYRHGEPVVAGEACESGPDSAISALAFYRGGRYPSAFDGALFFADHERRCIWALPLGADGEVDVAARLTFEAGAAAPTALEIGPDGDLFYVDMTGGTIRRIRYVGSTPPPRTMLRAGDRPPSPRS